ncbi:ABC transporter substrate-binding protein [Actinomyces urinae]|uniref:ABC transporter substrate-binding protein n=1 Tax=Actinomyces urinae TaxID=1689268 RepID=UPI001E508D3C|nr:sugar ABC transporter substrate-binding protein [Actinomyces urinae]
MAVASALALTACGGGTGQSSADGGQVELRWIMSADSQAEVDVWNHLAEMVTEKYPDIKVKFESSPFKDYYNKLTAQAASGDLACIAGLQAQRVPDVGSLFTDLNPAIEADGFDIDGYEPSIVEGLQQDGKQLAIPYDVGPYLLFYNKDMFDEAGVAEPSPGWSEKEFLDSAHALTKDGVYGYVADGNPDMWLPYALSIGGDYLKDGKPNLTDEKVVEGFKWVTELVTKEKVAPAPPATGAANWPADQWRNGNAAMYVDGPWQLMNAKKNVDFTLGISTVPAFDGSSVTTMSGTGFGVTESCKNPDEAWKAISVIIGPEAQEYIAGEGRGFPAYMAAQDTWYSLADVEGAKEAIDTAFETVNVYRTVPKWNQLSALMEQYGVEAFNGTSTPAEVLERVQIQVEN